MSGARARLAVFVVLFAGSSFGCWEQWSNDWFPQMKWQPAVQPFERTMHDGKVDLFLPPEGTLPVGDTSPPFDPNDDAVANALVNPRPMSLESLENGRAAVAAPHQPNRYSGRNVAVHGTSMTSSRVATCAMTKGATPLYMSI